MIESTVPNFMKNVENIWTYCDNEYCLLTIENFRNFRKIDIGIQKHENAYKGTYIMTVESEKCKR